MLGWFVRFALFKFLPRRIVPLLTLIEIARLAWGFRRHLYRVNDPRRSRTAPPPAPPRPSPQPPRGR
jgi:hypothetical protein